MRSIGERIILNEKIISAFIVLNAIVLYLIESGIASHLLVAIDIICLAFFIIEMTLKLQTDGWRGYWQDGWNRLDGTLVILSLPFLVTPFLNSEMFNFSTLLTLRLFRVVRFFRLFHLFPNITKLLTGLKRAIRQSWAILLGFFLIIIIFGLINCSLYKEVVPQFFGTPHRAIYTAFRIVTVEGWYEIPDAITASTSPLIGQLSRFYFCVQLALGGILGLSFINSVFVDAMVEDNNDDIKEKLREIESKLDEVLRQMN